MTALDWVKDRSTASEEIVKYDHITALVKEKRFLGTLNYKMRKELEGIGGAGYLANGNEYAEHVVSLKNKNGSYVKTLYLFQEFQVL
jgi:hypothetical protein